MIGLFDRDYSKLTEDEICQKKEIDAESRRSTVGKYGCINMFYRYPKAVRHNCSLFPNNYMDILLLRDVTELNKQCDGFEELLNDKSVTELDIKRYIQKNGYYHIPASIFSRYNFGHHQAVLFKEFQLGTSYKADYALAGHASGGWQFIFVEFENPYGRVILNDGNWGDVVRKGLNQIDEWKTFIESNYSTIYEEFRKFTHKSLPDEFMRFDSSRMNYVVVAGRRQDFENDTSRIKQRRLEQENNIKILHYDNLLDDARRLINANTY